MSRFIEILNEFRGRINLKTLFTIIDEMKEKLNARSAHLEIEFPYFIEKKAPVTGDKSLMEYSCKFCASHNKERDLYVEVNVPITTLCPCSKEISEFGAHNQRGNVSVKLRFEKFLWIEDIVKCVEESASSEVFSLLKRPDEKFLTEKAYSNPMFVEDVVRSVASKLVVDPNITWFSVGAENYESIHKHNAYAFVEKKV